MSFLGKFEDLLVRVQLGHRLRGGVVRDGLVVERELELGHARRTPILVREPVLVPLAPLMNSSASRSVVAMLKSRPSKWMCAWLSARSGSGSVMSASSARPSDVIFL